MSRSYSARPTQFGIARPTTRRTLISPDGRVHSAVLAGVVHLEYPPTQIGDGERWCSHVHDVSAHIHCRYSIREPEAFIGSVEYNSVLTGLGCVDF